MFYLIIHNDKNKKIAEEKIQKAAKKREDTVKKEARDENFFESITCFCCPRLGICQFIAIVSIVEGIRISSLIILGSSAPV